VALGRSVNQVWPVTVWKLESGFFARDRELADAMSAGTRPVHWVTWILCAAAAASGKRIGYYFCAVFSGIILFAPPIGTVLGWNMLRALRRNRDEFRARTRQRTRG
jgi:hypothetical protein